MIGIVNKLIFPFLLLFSGSIYAQYCDSTQWAQPGTYSVAIDSNMFEGNIPTSIIMLSDKDLCLIESNRKPTEQNQIHIGIYLVTIYPKKKVVDNTIDE